MDWPTPEIAVLVALLVVPATLFIGCGDPLPPDGPLAEQPPPVTPPSPPPTPTTAFQLNLNANLQKTANAQPPFKVRRIQSVFWTFRNANNPALPQVSFPLNPLGLEPPDAATPFLSPTTQPPLKTDVRNVDIGTRDQVICTVTLVLRQDRPAAPESTLTFNSGEWVPLKQSANHLFELSSDLTTPDRKFILTFSRADG